jgi:hypothetical protein
MEPVNLELSVPPRYKKTVKWCRESGKCIIPQVSSPLTTDGTVVGSKETPISLAVMTPLANKLSVTVGMEEVVAGERVPKKLMSAKMQ